MAKEERMSVIITGDFNALGGDSAPWSAFSTGGLTDCWERAKSKSGPANTWNGFSTEPLTQERRIDWILVSPNVDVLSCATIDRQEDGRYPSDHFPVLARVKLARNG